jgi:hypothetical protein
MATWSVNLTVLGGRTKIFLDNFHTIRNEDYENVAVEKAIQKTLLSFSYPGTRLIKLHVSRKK